VSLLAALAAPGAGRAAVTRIRPDPALAEPAVLAHGPRWEKRVALTFDACTTRGPDPYDPRITEVLERLRVPATIFVGGGWAQREPAALLELARNPLFEIGNHTFTHPHLTRLSDSQIRDELLRTQAEITALTGRTPTLFRPPYGEYDADIVHVAAECGLRTVEYDLPSGDPDAHVTRQSLVSCVLREARPGSIVVMHINHPGFPTAEALPEIVDGLRARGFELVTVGALLHSRRPSGGPPAVRLAAARRQSSGEAGQRRFGFQRPSAAPVGSTITANQP
jgi:peptidoglycan/xylan/chitin deacetylase (PgdA/CDA1 family)